MPSHLSSFLVICRSSAEPIFVYEGGAIAEEQKSSITSVRIGPEVEEIPSCAFQDCHALTALQLNEGLRRIGVHAFCNTALQSVTLPSTVVELLNGAFSHCKCLTEVQLNEGLQVVGVCQFEKCEALRSVTLPSTVIEVGYGAFIGCYALAEVQLNEGLQDIGKCAFHSCWELRSLTIPSTVNELADRGAFFSCASGLSDMTLMGGDRFLNGEFLDRGVFSEEQGLLNQVAIRDFFFDDEFNGEHHYGDKPTTLKVSVSCLVGRMARLPHECRVSVEIRIRHLPRLELTQDGTVLACIPVVASVSESDSESESDSDFEADAEDESAFDIQATDIETARSLYQVLQLIAFHELRECSILIELAMWKSRIDEDRARADCRVPIPDPAKSLIMEYGGFAGFLAPAIN